MGNLTLRYKDPNGEPQTIGDFKRQIEDGQSLTLPQEEAIKLAQEDRRFFVEVNLT